MGTHTHVNHHKKADIQSEFKKLVKEFNAFRKEPLMDTKSLPKSAKEHTKIVKKRLAKLDHSIGVFKQRFENAIKANSHPESLLSIMYISTLYKHYAHQITNVSAPVIFDDVMKKMFNEKMKKMAEPLLKKSHKSYALFTAKCAQLKVKETCENFIQKNKNLLPTVKKNL